MRAPNDALEVILVNSKSNDHPVKPSAIAQANLNGGGEHEHGRATSFLPRSAAPADGDILKQSQSSVERLEAEQKKLLTQLAQTPVTVATENPTHEDAQTPPTDHVDPSALAHQIARMEAQLDKQINDYNARPRRGFIGPNTRGTSYAMYYMQWKDKVERIGTINYPEEARGRIYGDLILTVTLNPDGSIYNDEITVTRSSGFPVLDRAAKRIVRLAAPYGHFHDDMRQEYDLFEIITRFTFTRGDGFEANIERK